MNKMLAIAETEEYTSKQYSEMMELLREKDRHTVRRTISDPADVLLDARGRLQQNGFKLTPLALRQICGYVSRGLWSLAADIAGISTSERSYDNAVSVPLAARIINDCVQLRFRALDGLTGRDMIQDHLERVVDGVVGPRYQLLANCQFLEIVDELMRDHEVLMKFHAGTVVGRRLTVIYLTTEPLVETEDGPMYGGFYFGNSEAGECGVRCAAVLQIGHTLRCMHRLRHLNHSGTTFKKRLLSMLCNTMASWEKAVEVAKQAPTRMAKEVNFLTPEGKLSKAARMRLQTYFSEYVDKRIAADVARKAIFMGADGSDVPSSVSAAEIEKRQVRDVVIATMRTAFGQYPELRENLERAAFDILAGKAKF